MKRSLLIGIFCLCAQVLWAQDNKMLEYANTIQAKDLESHLNILASDEYEGRETGEKGQKMAAEYIKKHFEKLGLRGPVTSNPDNPYFQPFELEKVYMDKFTITTPGGEVLNVFDEFFPYGKFMINEKTEVVFVGYGIETDTYSDYTGIDVKDKTVMILLGEPKNKKGESLLADADKSKAISAMKIKLAKAKGAKSFILVYEKDAEFIQRNLLFQRYYSKPSLSFPKDPAKPKTGGIIYTTTDAAQKMLGVSKDQWSKAMKFASKPKKSIVGKLVASGPIEMVSQIRKKKIITENVLGFLEGTDKKDEVVVLTAHYDHVGIIDGEIHNGADDDGSGTVAVLEMAEAFSKAAAAGHRPRRSILFMTVTGEEKGLLGSEYYSDNPIFPLENTVVNLNTDMVGRIDPDHEGNPNYVYVIGSDMLSSDLHNLHEEVAERNYPKLELDYTYNSDSDPNRYYYRSDHYNFAKHNIPVIFYFNGTHADYHKPTDTVEKINFDKIAHIAKLAFSTAWVIANREARLEVDKAKVEE